MTTKNKEILQKQKEILPDIDFATEIADSIANQYHYEKSTNTLSIMMKFLYKLVPMINNKLHDVDKENHLTTVSCDIDYKTYKMAKRYLHSKGWSLPAYARYSVLQTLHNPEILKNLKHKIVKK